MALQEILRQVEQAGRGEADAISTATRAEAEAILSEGKAEGEQVDETFALYSAGGWKLTIGALLQDPRMVFY